ncbi:hypothetical protein [Tomitella gaofuii]|uniref:hypothetical protein n=1 Tax=Tomitella gaofuii TaxID=2760083 RepID=UPI0015FBD469|nr:hypothetical protein [Tomitella gaofuii]
MNTIEHGPQDQTVDEFKQELRRTIDHYIDHLVVRADVASTLDAQTVAGRMIASVPLQLHPFDEAAGPFYDSAGLEKWFDISRQAIDKRVRAGKLIAAQLDGGRRVYPAWQFTPEAQVHPALLPTWRILRAHGDPWTAILWLTTPNPTLDGDSAADWLTAGRDPKPVEAAARADSARWAA